MLWRAAWKTRKEQVAPLMAESSEKAARLWRMNCCLKTIKPPTAKESQPEKTIWFQASGQKSRSEARMFSSPTARERGQSVTPCHTMSREFEDSTRARGKITYRDGA